MKPIPLHVWCEVCPNEAAAYIGDLREILKEIIELDDGDATYWWNDKRMGMLDEARHLLTSDLLLLYGNWTKGPC